MKKIYILILFLISTIFSSYSQDLSLGLVGFWKLECNAIDETMLGGNATIKGNPLCIKGKISNALQLNGIDEYLELPTSKTKEYISANGFSWSLWFKCNEIPSEINTGISQTLISACDSRLNDDIILGFGSSLAKKSEFVFEADGSGGFGAAMFNPLKYAPVGGFQKDTWYYVTAVRDYTNRLVILYFNGVEVARQTFTGSSFTRDLNLSIGACFDGTKIEGVWNGALDEVRIYNRVLTPLEIDYLYQLRADQIYSDENPIDFGKVFCSYQMDTTIIIHNQGPSTVNISGIRLAKGTDFSISNAGAFDLIAKETHELNLSFNSNIKGNYYDTIIVSNTNSLPELLIPIHAELINFGYTINGISNDTLDFGYLCPNQSKDTSFIIANNSEVQTRYIGELSPPFSITNNSITDNSSIFDIGETRTVNINFVAPSNDTLINQILYIKDTCGNRKEIFLRALVSIPNYTVNTDDTLKICPTASGTRKIKVTNNGKYVINIGLSGDNLNFNFSNSEIIPANNEKEIEIAFLGSDIGGIHTLNLLIDAGCGQDTSVFINVYVSDIDIRTEPNFIDFGDLVLCKTDTSISRKYTIINNNIYKDIKIIDIIIPEGYKTDLSVGEVFPFNTPKEFNMTFQPGIIGDFSGNIEILFDTCSINKQIGVSGKAKNIEYIINETLDFHKVLNYTYKDSVIALINTGSADFEVIGISSIESPFELVGTNPSLPVILKTGDTCFFTIRFDAIPEIQTDKCIIELNTACGDIQLEHALLAEGGYLADVTLQIPNLSAYPGDIINIPIKMVKSVDMNLAKIQNFKASISMNKSLYIPYSEQGKGEIVGNKVLVDVELPAILTSDTATLLVLPYKIALGDSDIDTIRIINSYSVGGFANIDTIAGIFTLQGVCRQGGNRLISADNTLYLSEIKPNPVSKYADVEYEIIERGITKLYIVDLYGNNKNEVISKFHEPGFYHLQLDISELVQGIYLLVLETPTQLERRKLIITK